MPADKITPVTAYAYATKDLWANVPIVGTDAAGATDYYSEQIISVKPDVILCSYPKELADEVQTKTGIPVVAVPMGTLFGKKIAQEHNIIGCTFILSNTWESQLSFLFLTRKQC